MLQIRYPFKIWIESSDLTNLTPARTERPLHDLLLRVIGPILVMLMVGSLVYLMIEVFYRGPHDGRLRWVFGLFTLATVLVSRIAIEDGLERASLFGFGLGIATLITGMRLVEFDYGPFAILEPLFLGLFILVVMWSANRLTWDCTLIDDSRDVSAIGLIDIVKRKLSLSRPIDNTRNQSNDENSKSAEAKPGSTNKLLFLLFAGSKTRNTPGLWVLYFSLAAFPIFGLGQWFAQRDPEAGYWWIFALFAVYLGAGLGLLMLTSVLGLERYLKKRGARMPAAVMRNWLIVGAMFALAIMFAVVMMPRPDLSSQLERSLAFLISPDREPSKMAVGKDGQREGARPAGNKVQDDPNAPAANSKKDNGKDPSGKNGNSSSKSGQKKGDSKSQTASKDSPGSRSKSRNSKAKPAKEAKSDPQPNETPNQSEKENNTRADAKRAQQQQPENDQNKRNAKNKDANRNAVANAAKRKPEPANANKRQQAANRKGRQAPAQASPPAGNFFAKAGRYLTYLIGLIILAILIWMFRKELSEFWNQLFQKKATADSNKTESFVEATKSVPGFRTFREPFKSGLAAKWTNAQIIQYTFAALEAWAYDRQHARDEDQTPFEFANQLAGLNEAISLEARQLADLHGRCLFGGGAVSKSETMRLAKLWNLMAPESGNAST
jgi:hypothetical protein